MTAEIIAQLNSADEAERSAGIDALSQLSENDPATFEANLSGFLGLFETQDDLFTLLQVSSAVRDTPMQGDHLDEIVACLDKMADRFAMDTDDDYDSACASNVFQALQNKLDTDQVAFQKHLPTLLKFLDKKSYVRNFGHGPITTFSFSAPHLLADHAERIFDLVRSGFTEILTPLLGLYSHSPEAFEKPENVQLLVEKSSELTYGSLAMTCLAEIAKKKPELIAPYAAQLAPLLTNPMAAGNVLVVFEQLAEHNPEAIAPYLPQIQSAGHMNPGLQYQVLNVMGIVGRLSEDKAREVLGMLVAYLHLPDHNVVIPALSAFRNVGQVNKELLAPYIPMLQPLLQKDNSNVRDLTQDIIDYYEGKDLSSIKESFEKLNKQVKDSISSVEDLKKYVDENVADLKNFLAEIAKKLPIPCKFTSEGRFRKTLKLHFVCEIHGSRCLFPEDRAFTTETKALNKWLKVAVSAVKTGISVVTGDAEDSIENVREMYKEATGEEDSNFLAIVNEPFLTSEEQDYLINQLRDAQFFNVFNYQAQSAQWCCTMCNLPG